MEANSLHLQRVEAFEACGARDDEIETLMIQALAPLQNTLYL